ncbi:hypothetical protein HFO65_30140 [Rhizobium laguerreae]|uniref:hypothetical protein n=1 Tax=Rhizobium laguerreae TaxID=1076926 RepID=UPI001441458C|nr:hypothetical protein [Rhizobium laguerreae]MBY3142427.1 hypothetical protein [Rhizobium laguerreae]MBY3164856.1 hypothetical protein [Rhizobium laguerreae]MBY3205155.1 hypothetical protein [Rhizobium laguerreae]MBY3266345.1 hypothetical protein [Rhizobium laguerreae]MBY3341134.1 hypothetical protein [Rhizobium laguerreae]
MDSLLFFLGDILSEWLTGNSSKSKFMRWVERIVVFFAIVLITLVLFYMYRT